MKLITVIVPVYNVEKYLKRCLDSIAHQSFKNLEIILVDDGSTDNSGIICDDYCSRDSRFRVIHQCNSGQSVARNTALRIAKGRYICFVDSDDYMENNMIETLYQSIVSDHSDIAVCGYKRVDENNHIIKTFSPSHEKKVIGRDEAVCEVIKDIHIFSFLWDKLFKREILENIKFPENKVFEDVATMYRIVHKAERISLCPFQLYNYMERNGSTVDTYNEKRLKNQIEAYMEQKEFAKDHNYIHVIPWIDYHIAETKRRKLHWYFRTKNKKSKSLIRKLKEEYRREIRFILFQRDLSMGRKTAAFVLAYFTWAYRWLFQIKN